jgi:hypothetical protein
MDASPAGIITTGLSTDMIQHSVEGEIREENTYLLVITHPLCKPTELGELEIITIIKMILTRMQ